MTDYDIAIKIVKDYIETYEQRGHEETVRKLKQLRKDIEEAINDDLEKAKWYLQREINNRYKQQDDQPNHDIVSYDKSSERLLKAQIEEQADRFREAMEQGDNTEVF